MIGTRTTPTITTEAFTPPTWTSYTALYGGPGVPDTPPLRVIVSGSRRYPFPALVRVGLTRAWREAGQPIVVVHGACPTGADQAAHEWALEHAFAGIIVEPHPAEWGRWGRAAGPRRNQRLVDLGAWRALIFPDPHGPSHGTRDCLRRARAAGLDIRYPAAEGAA